MYYNSIKNISKQLELNEFLISKNIDIISLNETNLKNSSNFELKNYNIIRHNLNGKKQKGGSALIINKKYNYNQITLENTEPIEAIAIELCYENRSLLIITLYARPKCNVI